MLQKMTRTSEKGFTLIELMIVIAIIGILAAIAIPNFIAYRNKAFCSAAEADANSVAGTIANWYAIPAHNSAPTAASLGFVPSGTNTFSIAGGPNTTITITVTDKTGRCPADYTNAATSLVNPKAFWTGNMYTKIMAD